MGGHGDSATFIYRSLFDPVGGAKMDLDAPVTPRCTRGYSHSAPLGLVVTRSPIPLFSRPKHRPTATTNESGVNPPHSKKAVEKTLGASSLGTFPLGSPLAPKTWALLRVLKAVMDPKPRLGVVTYEPLKDRVVG